MPLDPNRQNFNGQLTGVRLISTNLSSVQRVAIS